jgi:CBS domain-containing protein
MLIKDVMTSPIICCTPWDTVQTAARLMKAHEVGAIVVVMDTSDPLLEGVVTDRDLCCGIVAPGKTAGDVPVGDLMTPVPVTCGPEDTLDECLELMQGSQVRRIPVVDERGRCLGVVAQTDVALYGSTKQIADTVKEISKLSKAQRQIHFEKDYFFCGQPHETDEILLLNRRRALAHKSEVLR